MRDEGLYLPNCQTNLVISLSALSLLFCNFISTTAYQLGRYELSSQCDQITRLFAKFLTIYIDETLPNTI